VCHYLHFCPLEEPCEVVINCDRLGGFSFNRNPFGIAFDIDGVLLRGREPIGRAPESLARLYKDVKNGKMHNKMEMKLF
jgi:hypothetical protein